MATTQEDRIRKIEALLRKAEATAGQYPEEAAAFTAKARELMVEHSITEAHLRAAKPAESRTDDIDHAEFVIFYSATQQVDVALLWAIARSMKLKGFYTPTYRWDDNKNKNAKCQVHKIFGFPEDLDALRSLYMSLKIQRTAEVTSKRMRDARKAEGDALGLRQNQRGGHGITFRNSFGLTFASTIHKRLVAQQQHIVDNSPPSTALVLADQSDVLATWFADKHERTLGKATRSSTKGSAAGAAGGREAGARASINSEVR